MSKDDVTFASTSAHCRKEDGMKNSKTNWIRGAALAIGITIASVASVSASTGAPAILSGEYGDAVARTNGHQCVNVLALFPPAPGVLVYDADTGSEEFGLDSARAGRLGSPSSAQSCDPEFRSHRFGIEWLIQ